MTFSSTYDHLSDQLVHAPGRLEETAQVLSLLTEANVDAALGMLSTAAVEHTGRASASELSEEAESALLQLLADPDEASQSVVDDNVRSQDDEWSILLRQAVTVEVANSMGGTGLDWLRPRAFDLAQAMATYWLNLGTDDHSRAQASHRLTERGGDDLGFSELAKRFDLPAQNARMLLSSVARTANQSNGDASSLSLGYAQ